MKKQECALMSFASAAGVFVYVALIAWFGFHSQEIFGNQSTFLTPLFALLLFVVSACITGLLVFGKPVHLYLSGKKTEAFTLLFATIGWLVCFLALVVVALALQ